MSHECNEIKEKMKDFDERPYKRCLEVCDWNKAVKTIKIAGLSEVFRCLSEANLGEIELSPEVIT